MGGGPALARALDCGDRNARAVLHDLEELNLVELERANGRSRRPTAALLTGHPWGAFGVDGARMHAARTTARAS